MRLLPLPLFFVSALAFAQNPTPRPSPIPSPLPGTGGMIGIGLGLDGGVMGELEGQSPSCTNTRQAIEGRAYYIKKNFQTENVERPVKALQAYMNHCKVDPAKYGWGKGTFEVWKKEGYKAELAVLKNRIERQSLVGKVSEKDLAEYKTFSERLGVSNSDITSFLKEQSSTAASNKTSCEKKDLRNETLGATRDQDSIGWCYAFAAADLLTYKTGKKVSASDVSLNYNSGWIKDLAVTAGRSEASFEGGRIEGALGKMKEIGICLEKDFRSDDMAGGSLKEMVDTVDRAKKKFEKGQRICDTGQAATAELFPNINMNDYNEIIDKSSRAEFLTELQQKSCGKRESIPNIEVVHENATIGNLNDQKKLTEMIDAQLDKNNISGFGYDATTIMSSFFERAGGERFMHGSVIVGRRFNEKSNSCEYLIRNSWGKSCGSYRFPLECEEGHVWVPKEDLMKGLTNVTYIK